MNQAIETQQATQTSSTSHLTDRQTGAIQEVPNTGGEVTATGASDLHLNMPAADILGTMRTGDDLVVNLANGAQIIVRDFFAFPRVGDVIDATGAQLPVDTDTDSGGGVSFATIGLAGLGLAALAGGGGGGGSGNNSDGPAAANPSSGGTGGGTSGGGTSGGSAGGGASGGSAGGGTSGGSAGGGTSGGGAGGGTSGGSGGGTPMLTPAEMALQTINAYNGNNDAPMADDYATTGLTRASADRIYTANVLVEALNDSGVQITSDRLQHLVDLVADLELAFGRVLPTPGAMTVTVAGNTYTIHIDIDGNGSPDRSMVVAVNNAGVPTSIVYDFSNDGTVDRRDTFTNNALGQRTREQIDNDADGETDVIYTYDWNAAGHLVRGTIDNNADGQPDEIQTFQVDAAGNWTGVSFDTNNDGEADEIQTFELNDAAQTIRTLFDLNADGEVDRIETYQLNNAGHRIRNMIDTNADGTANEIETYQLNAAGQVVRATFDTDADGEAEGFEIYALNGEGHRIRETSHLNPDDGTPERTDVYLRTAANGLVAHIVDNDSDNFIDGIELNGGVYAGGYDFNLQSSYSGLTLQGLDVISLASTSYPSELTVHSARVADIANGTAEHVVRVAGNIGDSVTLQGDWAIRDMDGDGNRDIVIPPGEPAYAIYDAREAGTVIGTFLVDVDVTVLLT